MSGTVTAKQFAVDVSAPLSIANEYFSIPAGFVNGSTSAPSPTPFWVQYSDQVASIHPLHGVFIRHSFGGGGMTGNRNGLTAFISLNASPNAADSSQKNYVAGLFQGYSVAAADPTKTGGNAYSGYAGSLWGISANVWLANGAANFYGIYGAEIDVAIDAGSSAAQKYGLMVVQTSADASRGVIDDAAVAILNQPHVTTGWASGLQFGGAGSDWPFTATSTLINAKPRSQPVNGAAPALHGVDFRAVQFAGLAFASQGFSVDAEGNLLLSGAASRNYADDAAAAAGGVPVDGVYHSGGVMRIRLA